VATVPHALAFRLLLSPHRGRVTAQLPKQAHRSITLQSFELDLLASTQFSQLLLSSRHLCRKGTPLRVHWRSGSVSRRGLVGCLELGLTFSSQLPRPEGQGSSAISIHKHKNYNSSFHGSPVSITDRRRSMDWMDFGTFHHVQSLSTT